MYAGLSTCISFGECRSFSHFLVFSSTTSHVWLRDFVAWEGKLIPSPKIPVFGNNKERKMNAKGREIWVKLFPSFQVRNQFPFPNSGLNAIC